MQVKKCNKVPTHDDKATFSSYGNDQYTTALSGNFDLDTIIHSQHIKILKNGRVVNKTKKISEDYLSSTTTIPIFFICDAEPDSHDPNNVLLDYGVILIIAARANSVGHILKIDSENNFRREHIPGGTIPIYNKMLWFIFRPPNSSLKF